jgi:hypothetical protein
MFATPSRRYGRRHFQWKQNCDGGACSLRKEAAATVLGASVRGLQQRRIEAPPTLVEMSNAQVRRIEGDDFEGVPEGVELVPGSIVLRFSDPEEAFQKLFDGGWGRR